MKKINFCKATTIILIINVILSIVLFFVVPDKIAIQWVGTSPSNAVDSYYVFLVPVLSVLFAEPSADTGIFVDDDRGGYDTGCGLWIVVSAGGGDVFRTDG